MLGSGNPCPTTTDLPRSGQDFPVGGAQRRMRTNVVRSRPGTSCESDEIAQIGGFHARPGSAPDPFLPPQVGIGGSNGVRHALRDFGAPATGWLRLPPRRTARAPPVSPLASTSRRPPPLSSSQVLGRRPPGGVEHPPGRAAASTAGSSTCSAAARSPARYWGAAWPRCSAVSSSPKV